MFEEKGKNKISFKIIWSTVMALVYFLIGYLVAFTPVLFPYTYRQGTTSADDFLIPRVVLAFGLFAFGIFRIYRVVKYKK